MLCYPKCCFIGNFPLKLTQCEHSEHASCCSDQCCCLFLFFCTFLMTVFFTFQLFLAAIFHCILPVPLATTCVLCVSLLLLLYNCYWGVKQAYICVYIYYPFCTVLLLFTMYLSFYSVVGYIKREGKVLYSQLSPLSIFSCHFSLMLLFCTIRCHLSTSTLPGLLSSAVYTFPRLPGDHFRMMISMPALSLNHVSLGCY